MIKIVLLTISFLFFILPVSAFALEEELIDTIIIDEPITQIKNFIQTPLNWIILFGAYIGIYISQAMRKDINYVEVFLYGTFTWIVILLIMTIGLNMLLLNYAFISPSIVLAVIMFIAYGFFDELLIVAIIGFLTTRKK